MEINELQKYVILLAHANDEPIRYSLKLHSMMFFLTRVVDGIKRQTMHDAGTCGPRSKEVDAAIRYLEGIGLLAGSDGEIEITEEGNDVAKDLVKNEDKDTENHTWAQKFSE